MRRAAALLGPLALWCATLFWLSSRPGNALPPLLPGLDKLAHFTAYALMGLLAARAGVGLGRSRRAAWLLAVAFCSLYGVSDELHQSFVPLRSVDAWDWVADTLGAASGAGAWLARAVPARAAAGPRASR